MVDSEMKKAQKEEKAREKKVLASQKKHAKPVQMFGTRSLSAMTGMIVELRMAVDTMNGSGAGKFPPMTLASVEKHLSMLEP